jgi:DNA-binding IclR family transcriptional regulator
VQSVDRAMMLVKGVADSPHPPSVWELAQQSGLNRSTAWRILTTLEHHGMVERDPATARYHVGHAAMHLAAAADYDGVVRRVRPILTAVAEHVGESVTLAAVRRFTLVYIDQVDPSGVQCPDWMGRPLPLHATSSGKVFLAWLPEEERDAVLPPRLNAYTRNTITDRKRLDAEFEEIRRVGYSTCTGEFEQLQNGASAAVLDGQGRPMIIVNVWGPSSRVTPERLADLGQVALITAYDIGPELR